MKILRLLLIATFLFKSAEFLAQPVIPSSITVNSPGGFFDAVYDRLGNQFYLSNLNLTSSRPIGGTGSTFAVPSTSCNAGYFNLYYSAGSYLANNATARGIVCQVFSDITGLLMSPLSPSPNVGPKVNIYCTDVTTSGLAGAATSFFVFPASPASSNPGIIEGQVPKMIKSGVDPYSNIPLTFFAANSYYHGYLEIDPYTSWDLNMYATATASLQLDLYSVTLHEVLHMLGFNSLIGPNGTSKFNTAGNYFNLYDQFLYNSSGVPLLSSSNLSCYKSNANFTLNPIPSIYTQTAGCVNDITPCSSAAQYISSSTNVKVYTPNCFEGPSSLSHFEDMCTTTSFTPVNTTSCTPTPSAPGCNNLYFVMSNSNGSGGGCFIKRYPKEEERAVLCDLGYSVNATYTSVAAVANHTYASGVCSPSNIFGYNDGLANNVYTITTTGTTAVIQYTQLTTNDLPASSSISVTCLESVYSGATVTPGTSGTDCTVTAGAGSGLALLKYLPFNGTITGNATYVYVYFMSTSCPIANTCSLISNGGFESLSGLNGCGPIPSSGLSVDCWEVYEGGAFVYSRGCTTTPGFNLGVNTFGTPTNSPLESFNGPPNNNKAVGLTWVSPSSISPSLKTNLTLPIVPSGSYQVSFFVNNYAGYYGSSNFNIDPVVITIACYSNVAFSNPGPFPTGLETIAEFTINTGTNWAQVTQTFVFSPSNPVNHPVFVIGINVAKTMAVPTSSWVNGNGIMCYIDQVSLLPLPSPTFVIPGSTLCVGQGIQDLAQYASSVPGSFSGPGVTYNGGQYDFNIPGTMTPGIYPIAFTYTINGCPYSIFETVTISTLSVINPTHICLSTPTLNLISLLTNPSYSLDGYFQVNTFVSNPPNWTFGSAGINTVAFTFTQNALCPLIPFTTTIQAHSVPGPPNIYVNSGSASSYSSCLGNTVTLSTDFISNHNYLWSPGNMSGLTQSVSPGATTIYTLSVFEYSSCAATSQLQFSVTHCCNSVSIPTTITNPITAFTSVSGPLLIAQSLTVAAGGHLFLTGDVRVTNNASIIAAPLGTIELGGVHLHACENYLWPGIVVQNSANVIMPLASDNLIEDAVTAVDLSNLVENPFTRVEIHSTTFNKNYVGIRFKNYQITSNTYGYVLSVDNSVFTSRNLPFTTTAWPGTGTVNTTSTTSADLRYETSSSSLLGGPYLGQSGFTVTNINGATHPSHIAIQLENIGVTNSSGYSGFKLGDPTQSNFNVFDAHGTFISAENSNVTSENIVFQNTQRYNVVANPGGLITVLTTTGGNAIYSKASSLMNTALTLTGTTHATGNRFYDCHFAVKGDKVFQFDSYKSTFRSNQSAAVQASLNFVPPGSQGIALSTNRFAYMMRYNEFTNINSCISIPVISGPYSTGSSTATGVYASYIGVVQNTFAAAQGNTAYIGNAVGVSCANNFTFPAVTYTNVSPAASGIFIKQNTLTNVYQGISINGNGGLFTEVSGNNLLLQGNFQLGNKPFAVEVTNCLASQNGTNHVVVHQNIAVGSGTNLPKFAITNERLFYSSMNSGTNSPRFTCNELSDTYMGFIFDNYNNDAVWAGNVMHPIVRGLVLTNYGEIGPQGDNSTSSANTWAGIWQASGHFGTYVANSSTAGLSPLWCPTSSFYPPNNNGNVISSLWYGALNGNLFSSAGGDYNCLGVPNNISVPVPTSEKYDNTSVFGITQNLMYRSFRFDPAVPEGPAAMSDFLDDLEASTTASFAVVEKKLYEGDYSGARTLLAEIEPADVNLCESSYKEFYSLYANYLEAIHDSVEFSMDDSTSLFTLANLCPGLTGPAVYQARALYRSIYPYRVEFEECEGLEGEGSRVARKNNIEAPAPTGTWQIALFPNPAQDKISIKCDECSFLNVIIFDAAGRERYNGRLVLNNGVSELFVTLEEGLYLIKIETPGHESVFKKLVIAK